MMWLSTIFFGAFFYRFRGGGGTNILRYFGINKSFPAQKVIYSLLLAALMSYSKGWVCFVVMTIAVRISISWGWGSYISGLFDRNYQLRGDLKIVDKIIIHCKSPYWGNAFALFIRGSMMGATLGLGYQYFCSIYLVGLPTLFGILLAGSFMLSDVIVDDCKWGMGEMIFGATTWPILYFLATFPL